MIANNIRIVINIPHSGNTRDDAFLIRQESIRRKILCVTTVPGTKALVNGLIRMRDNAFGIHSLQEIHART
jgi:hypothetical protein